MKEDKLAFKTAHFNSKTQIIINKNEVYPSIVKCSQQILNRISVWISEGSGWIVESLDGHHINIVIYKPLKGSNNIDLPLELKNPGKGLINIKNNDDECFRW